MSSSPAVAIENLVYRYPGKRHCNVLDIPRWQVQRGEQLFLQGPSGSGKTTLLNLVAGVTRASAGTLQVLGTDLARLGGRQRDHFRAAHIGVVFQQFNLIPYLSVLDNLLLAAHLGNTPAATARERAASLFDALELHPRLLREQPGRLSSGQQQRVAIARALVSAPQLLIADEPTSALDSQLRDSFVRLLLTLTAEWQSTLIFVSHDNQLAHHFQRTVMLADINRAGVSQPC